MWFLLLIYPVGIFSVALNILLLKYFYEFLITQDTMESGDKSFKTKFYYYSFVIL